MVLMEESGDKPGLVIDREPDGLNDIVQSSRILEASHVREVGHKPTQTYTHKPVTRMQQLFINPTLSFGH